MRFGKFDPKTTQGFQGTIDIFSSLNAKIDINGAPISTTVQSVDLKVDLDEAATWQWAITPLTEGVHKLTVLISKPAAFNSSNPGPVLADEDFEINVFIPTPVPTFTPTVISTVTSTITAAAMSTSTPSPLSGSAKSVAEQTVAAILAAGILTIIGFSAKRIYNYTTSRKAEKLREEKEKEFKRNLAKPPKLPNKK